MSLNPEQAQTRNFPQVPEGRQQARCFAIVDIGKHYFMGKTDQDPGQKVMLCFEFPKHMHIQKEGEAPRPLILCQEYSFALGDKAKLPKVLKSWAKLQKPITKLNLKPYLGQYCSLDIEHVTSAKDNTKKYSNIEYKGLAVKPFEGTEKPKAFYPNIWFDIDAFSWDQYNKLPFMAQKKLKESWNWSGIITKHPMPVNQNSSAIESGIETQSDDDSPQF